MLSVDDMEAQRRFYQHLLGLDVSIRDGRRWVRFDVDGMTFSLAGAEEQLPDRAALTVKVDDVDAAVTRATAAGATVVTPPTAGAHERRAAVRDPEGQLVVLYRSAHVTG